MYARTTQNHTSSLICIASGGVTTCTHKIHTRCTQTLHVNIYTGNIKFTHSSAILYYSCECAMLFVLKLKVLSGLGNFIKLSKWLIWFLIRILFLHKHCTVYNIQYFYFSKYYKYLRPVNSVRPSAMFEKSFKNTCIWKVFVYIKD